MEDPMQTTLQQPKPRHPKRGLASFLIDFVDPVYPDQSLYAFISDWLESVGSDCEKRCRSDSHIRRSSADLISRRLTRSAPEMSYARNADEFLVPPKPVSSPAIADTSVVPSGMSSHPSGNRGRLVDDPLYRELNLAANKIYLRHTFEPMPEHISSLVDYVRRDRDSPGPSPDQVGRDTDLHDLVMGSGEPDVVEYFRSHIFPGPRLSDGLKRIDGQPMSKHTVPTTGSGIKVSTPVPDMLYGYARHLAFPRQQAQLINMGAEPVANNSGLIYPFLVIEFKADGPTGVGSMWVGTNQCLGGSTSCVKIVELLNDRLRRCKSNKIQPVTNAAFSIAMNGTEARLYISWKHNELDYYMRMVENFLLQRPDHYLEFRKYVRNIIDWGKDRRLRDIRDSLDSLLQVLEESRKRASEAAKPRTLTSDGSATSSKRGKLTPHGRSSRTGGSHSSLAS
jgi:hypothetical protein